MEAKHIGTGAPKSEVTVIEFLGLPGAGKSTIAKQLVADLRVLGFEVRTTEDFVAWLGRQTRFQKFRIITRSLPSAILQLLSALILGCSLRPLRTLSIRRIASLPYINCCFEWYLSQSRGSVVVMDQANMQLVWSIGAFSERYSSKLVGITCHAAQGSYPRLFAFVSATATISAERVRERASLASRFDGLSKAELNGRLVMSVQLMSDISRNLARNEQHVISLDATAPVAINSARLLAELDRSLSPGDSESAGFKHRNSVQ